jgi:hypothetical protein
MSETFEYMNVFLTAEKNGKIVTREFVIGDSHSPDIFRRAFLGSLDNGWELGAVHVTTNVTQDIIIKPQEDSAIPELFDALVSNKGDTSLIIAVCHAHDITEEEFGSYVGGRRYQDHCYYSGDTRDEAVESAVTYDGDIEHPESAYPDIVIDWEETAEHMLRDGYQIIDEGYQWFVFSD